MERVFPVLVALSIVVVAAPAAAEQSSSETPDETTDAEEERPRLRHPRVQVPTIRNGGVLNPGETAFAFYVDGQLFPPTPMISYQYGLSYWITIGADVGGGYGAFQALLRVRMENLPPLADHRFFWGGHLRSGFKYHRLTLSEELAFDDISWVLTYENTFSVRLGPERRHVLYVDTTFYVDFDVTPRERQVDLYLMPVSLGYEAIIGDRWNFFIEVGIGYSINGTETTRGVLYRGSVFPTGTIGFGYRQPGPRSAMDSF